MENQWQPRIAGSSTALVHLLPALLQCFLTVACGYAAGRVGLLGPQQVRGLGNFISTFALPALLFKNMVELDIRSLNWDFLLAIAASKGFLFLIGCCGTLLGTWGPRRLAKAGLYAIFITQSNDFALGLPIVHALYKDSNPEFLQFLYMVAPISLLILNPIGFLLCEFQKLRCREGCGAGCRPGACRLRKRELTKRAERHQNTMGCALPGGTCCQSGCEVVQNKTLDIEDLGFLSDQLRNGCDQTRPIRRDVTGSATTESRLDEYAEHNVQSKWKMMQSICKALWGVLINPIVLFSLLGLLGSLVFHRKVPAPIASFIDDMGMAFSASAQFYLGLNMVGRIQGNGQSSYLTLLLLITAKVFVFPAVSCGFAGLTNYSTGQNHSSVQDFAFLYGLLPTAPSVVVYASHYDMEVDTLARGMVLCTLASAPLLSLTAWKLESPPSALPVEISLLSSVTFSASIASIVTLIWVLAVVFKAHRFGLLPHFVSTNLFFAQVLLGVGTLPQVLVFLLYYTCSCSSYLWTGLLALSLLLHSKERTWTGSRGLFIFIGWGIPLLVGSFLVIFGGRPAEQQCMPMFVWSNSQVALTLLFLCLSVISSVTCLTWFTQSSGRSLQCRLQQQPFEEEPRLENECYEIQSELCLPEDGQPLTHDHDESSSPQSVACCRWARDQSYNGHFLFTCVLTISMTLNATLAVWWLLRMKPSTPFIILKLTCVALTFGQGVISFCFFGLDNQVIINPLYTNVCRFLGRCGILWDSHGGNPDRATLSTRIQFEKYHLSHCRQDLAPHNRPGQFRGQELVDWLVASGLSSDRTSATSYAERLQRSNLLAGHSSNFRDGLHIYWWTL
uniref:lysosomal cholesterol signaling protein isoform X2 n=1 Tax=Myxine glutinosa TaxID=7769 RepID=UPI00358DE3CC